MILRISTFNPSAPNGLKCEHCWTDLIDRCLTCGAPQCCPVCCGGEVPGIAPAWMAKGKELEALWNAIVYHTQGDLFWIGEILLSEITKETGYKPPRPGADRQERQA